MYLRDWLDNVPQNGKDGKARCSALMLSYLFFIFSLLLATNVVTWLDHGRPHTWLGHAGCKSVHSPLRIFTARLFSTQLVSSAHAREDDILIYIIYHLKHHFLMFLEKDTTRHDYIELLEFGMQFQQTSKFEAVAKSCVSKDSGCTSCSRLRAGKHWYCPQHQVSQLTSSGNGLKTENSTFSK